MNEYTLLALRQLEAAITLGQVSSETTLAINHIIMELEKTKQELKPLRECYGPAGMKSVSYFIEMRDKYKKALQEIIKNYQVSSSAYQIAYEALHDQSQSS